MEDGLRKGQAIINKLYELNKTKILGNTPEEYENNINKNKAEILDKLYNISDDDFKQYFNI